MMQQRSKQNAIAFRESIVLTNEELTSNWSRLSKLIKGYEDIPWADAKPKAIELIQSGKALDYIENAKNEYYNQVEQQYNLTSPQVEPVTQVKKTTQVEQDPTPQLVSLDNPALNYQALLDLAPDLLTRIVQKGKYYSVARKRGYKEISLELLNKDRTGYYFQLITHQDRVGDGLYIQFDFYLDTVNLRIEALCFTDKNGTIEVYESRTRRTTVTTKEREDQNAYLFARLSDFLGWELSFNSEKSPEQIEQKKLKRQQKEKERKHIELDEFHININEQIPDFKTGEIEYLDIYKTIGVANEYIDKINRTGKAFIYIPVRDKKDVLDQRIAFEVTNTGKVFFFGKYMDTHDHTPTKRPHCFHGTFNIDRSKFQGDVA